MSTYSPNLRIELITTGQQAGTWGNTTDTNLGTLIEQAISGYVLQACTGGTDVITIPDGADGVARNMYLQLTGTGGGTLVVPTNKKLYFIYNATSTAITVKVSGLTGVSVPAGAKTVLVSNGTDIVDATNYVSSLSLGTALPTSSGGTGSTSASTGTGGVVLATSPTISSPTLSGTPVAPTASAGTNTTQIATTAFVTAALGAAYPVGAIFTSTVSTSPATLLGFGSWSRFGQGRVLLSADDSTYIAGATGGSADAITVSHTHSFSATTGSNNSSLTHTHNLIGSNDHYVADGGRPQGGAQAYPYSTGGSTDYGTYIGNNNSSLDHTHNVSGTTGSSGSSGTGANLQPYVVVYMWTRTA